MECRRVVVIILMTLTAAGCGEAWSRSFVRADPPVEAGGVRVALVDRQCDRENDPDWPYADILGLDLRVRVTNSAVTPVSFAPKNVRLLADGEARAPHRSDASEIVPPGGSKVFRVEFFERDDNLACNVPMALSVDGAVVIGNSPVAMRPLSFLVSTGDI